MNAELWIRFNELIAPRVLDLTPVYGTPQNPAYPKRFSTLPRYY